MLSEEQYLEVLLVSLMRLILLIGIRPNIIPLS